MLISYSIVFMKFVFYAWVSPYTQTSLIFELGSFFWSWWAKFNSFPCLNLQASWAGKAKFVFLWILYLNSWPGVKKESSFGFLFWNFLVSAITPSFRVPDITKLCISIFWIPWIFTFWTMFWTISTVSVLFLLFYPFWSIFWPSKVIFVAMFRTMFINLKLFRYFQPTSAILLQIFGIQTKYNFEP